MLLKCSSAARRLGLTPGMALDLRTGTRKNPAQRAKVWSHLQTERERPILIVGSQVGSGLGTSATAYMKCMIDVYQWQVSQGLFFVHEQKWEFACERGPRCDEIRAAVSC